jgi:hypothetical protein
MRIARLERFRGKVIGAGIWATESDGIVKETRGEITESTLRVGGPRPSEPPESTLTLHIDKKKFVLTGVGLPRLDVGEEVILHKDEGDVVAIQVIRGDKAVFRSLLPKSFRYGVYSYKFR